jgi:hypothetical protein
MRSASILIRFMGGLGNQLFQYALGRHLSLIHDRPLKFDISGYTATKPDWKAGTRLFGLAAFNVTGQIATAAELSEFETYRRAGTIGRIARLANSLTPFRHRRYIQEPPSEYWRFSDRILTSPLADHILLDGFWQSEKYFESIAATIRKDFNPTLPATGENAAMLSCISGTNSIAIHVRHGDNATGAANELGVLPLEYYNEAAGLIAGKVDKPHFFVFSDDPGWARDHLTFPGPTTFVVHNGDQRNYEDLRLMAACKHHVTANSTFSWWGAWLGKKDRQLVYAPAKYFISTERELKDFFPSGWNLLAVGPKTVELAAARLLNTRHQPC